MRSESPDLLEEAYAHELIHKRPHTNKRRKKHAHRLTPAEMKSWVNGTGCDSVVAKIGWPRLSYAFTEVNFTDIITRSVTLGNQLCLAMVDQGSLVSQRIGNTIRGQYVDVRCSVHSLFNDSSTIRFMCVVDKFSNLQGLAQLSLMGVPEGTVSPNEFQLDSYVHGPINRVNRERYAILLDESYAMDSAHRSKTFHWVIPLHYTIRYTGPLASPMSAWTNITCNCPWFLCMSTGSAGASDLEWCCTTAFYYTDE